MSDEPQPEASEQEVGEVQPGSELPRSFAGAGMNRSSNLLLIWGNRQTMNLNPLILENIQQSPYFKNTLVQLKTYQEVIDEIYYNVGHLEPWERGTRKPPTMLGGSRYVRNNYIFSIYFLLLYFVFLLFCKNDFSVLPMLYNSKLNLRR